MDIKGIVTSLAEREGCTTFDSFSSTKRLLVKIQDECTVSINTNL